MSHLFIKPLLLAGILSALLLFFVAGCSQNAPVSTSTPTLGNPQLELATFTPAAPQATPTATEAVPTPTPEAAAATLTATPIDTPEVVVTPTQAESGQQPPGGDGDCIDKAAFFKDVNIPDGTSFKQDVAFTKTWQIRNEGTCTWENYKLVFAGGNNLNGPPSNPLPVIKPGETAEISVALRSPLQGGVYTSLWEFESAGGRRFGVNSHGKDLIWVKISVSWYDETGQATGNVIPQTGAEGACPVTQNAEYVNQVLGLINQARRGAGLNPLTLQYQLSAAAFAHSQDMACKDFIDHVGSDRSTWYDRIKAQGYSYAYASENIYVGDPAFGGTPDGAFTWWMNSEVHRKNILSTKVTEIGIGYAYRQGSTYGGYYTLNFARP